MAAELIFISGGVPMPRPRSPLSAAEVILHQEASAFDLCVGTLIAVGLVLLFLERNTPKGASARHLAAFPMVLLGIITLFAEGFGWISAEQKAAAWRHFATAPAPVLAALGIGGAWGLFEWRKWSPHSFGVLEVLAGLLAVWFAKAVSGGHTGGLLISWLSGVLLMATGCKTYLDNRPRPLRVRG